MGFPRDTSGLALDELHRLVRENGGEAPPRFLAALAEDPRQGARALGRSLGARRRARRRERDRLRRLLAFERALWDEGLERVGGVDEAGMGPLAGPVVAAAVVLHRDQSFEGLDDSKKLDARARERLSRRVREEALAVSVGLASVEDIAERDIHQAGLLAMRRAVEGLDPAPQHLLVDARTVPGLSIPQDGHVKGDARSLSIAAASVVAKTHRDALMAELDREHPGYGFARHQGYGTPDHLEALERLGPCPAHRLSWDAVAEHAGSWSAAYYELRGALRSVEDREAFELWRRRAARVAAGLAPGELRRLEQHAARREEALPEAPGAEAGRLPFD